MRRILPKLGMREPVICAVIITTLTMGVRPAATEAMLAPPLSAPLDSVDSHRIADFQKIQRVLESRIVRQRLEDFGLTPEEIKARLSGLPDDQLHQFATEIDAIIPAGDGLGIVIALLVIAILAVIFIYLLNHRIVVTKNGTS